MEELNAPLYNAVRAASGATARFCMPGHSGASDGGVLAGAPYDFTEVEGLDNLSCPTGVIFEAERLAAKAQGCAKTLSVTEGSTVCMHIALSVAKERGAVGYIGDMHRSFFGGCALLGIEPIGYESAEDFVQKTSESRNVSSVFYTSPDYFGNVVKDDELIGLCKKKGILTVTDAAHGAHFAYSPLLPNAAAGRADISFCSLHKTMCAYTGAAFLNLVDDALYDEAVYFRQLWHTTSPSYLVMASADRCRALYERDGEKIYADILEARKMFEATARNEYAVEKSDDFSRLVLRLEGRDAAQACSYLVSKGIYAEAAIGDKLIFILTRDNCVFLPLLAQALSGYTPAPLPAFAMPACREKTSASGRVGFVPVSECEGRVCMNEVGFYPPGVPFIGRGEIFTADDVAMLAKNTGCTFGLVNGKAVVLQ